MALDFCDFELERDPSGPAKVPAPPYGLKKVLVLPLTTMDLSQVRRLTERLRIMEYVIPWARVDMDAIAAARAARYVSDHSRAILTRT
jgi:hypothetical protein